MKIGIPTEILPEERRVAAHPETVAKMIKAGFKVCVEANAGIRAYIQDKAYSDAGATIEKEHETLLHKTDIVLKVNRPLFDDRLGKHEVDCMQPGALLIAPLYLQKNPDLRKKIEEKKLKAFSLDSLPRIARAQSMDILSSQSNLSGYKSVVMSADYLGKIFPMMTTAAGTILPAKVIVIGAGVAGLQAIATARRLGGVVIAFDTRPVVAEQVKSLGADFVSLETSHDESQDLAGYAKEQTSEFYQKEQEIIRKYSHDADVIITTALIPGKRAPILITDEMVKEMKEGSVIFDLAAEQEGNCTLTRPGKIITQYGVTIIGILNVPSTMPVHATLLYSRNIFSFLNYIMSEQNISESTLENIKFNLNDDIIKATMSSFDKREKNA